ncbi:hypothetical protein FACS1894139_04340 [Planctomycetales bacterium]|nr:hypothetical protein FACS1894107_02000 [Planctomycetales bacterium]GHS99206.1 hypothetical protein FACS1894108_08750 [Planctomycetales bacterium]GHT03629.1 hypothetical protein FACS1894139_04340 [Planctomycetales bacterium]
MNDNNERAAEEATWLTPGEAWERANAARYMAEEEARRAWLARVLAKIVPPSKWGQKYREVLSVALEAANKLELEENLALEAARESETNRTIDAKKLMEEVEAEPIRRWDGTEFPAAQKEAREFEDSEFGCEEDKELEAQSKLPLNPQDLAAGEKRHQLVTDANGKEYYQFAHRDDEGNPFYCEAPTLDECRHACDVWTVTKYLDGKVENPNPLVKEFVEQTKAIRDDASAELAKKWGLPYEQKPADKTSENEKPKTVEKEVAPVKRDAGMGR